MLEMWSLQHRICHWILLMVVFVNNCCFCREIAYTPWFARLQYDIYCTIKPDYPFTKEYTAEDITFSSDKGSIFDKSDIKIINRTTAKLHVMRDTYPLYYLCTLPSEEDASPFGIEQIVVDSKNQTVIVANDGTESKPRKVRNFNCQFYNWLSLNCTWKELPNVFKSTYSAYYQLPRDNNTWYPCPIQEKEKCGWTLDTNPPYIRSSQYLRFMIKGTNKMGNVSQQIYIDHYARLIVDPPNRLIAFSKRPFSVRLKFDNGDLKNFAHLIYAIRYTTDSSILQNILMFNNEQVEKANDSVEINITGLPYTNTLYHFSVYMKSAFATDDAYWSKPVSVSIKTKPCLPYKAPEVDIGTFHVSNSDSNTRNVTFFWKPLPKEERNGDDLWYDIKVVEGGQDVNLRPVVLTSTYAKFANLSTKIRYGIYVTAVNSEGYSPASSFGGVFDDLIIDLIPKITLFTQYTGKDGAYQLRWEVEPQRLIYVNDFTIFWCEFDQEHQCVKLVKWISVDADTRSYEITNAGRQYQFAISVNTGIRYFGHISSTGMVFATESQLTQETLPITLTIFICLMICLVLSLRAYCSKNKKICDEFTFHSIPDSDKEAKEITRKELVVDISNSEVAKNGETKAKRSKRRKHKKYRLVVTSNGRVIANDNYAFDSICFRAKSATWNKLVRGV